MSDAGFDPNGLIEAHRYRFGNISVEIVDTWLETVRGGSLGVDQQVRATIKTAEIVVRELRGFGTRPGSSPGMPGLWLEQQLPGATSC